jgi:pimeloyl-ACP methyl ester carboxylesterase
MPPQSRMRWLLLRGLGREQRHWGSFPRSLEAALNVEVTCLDLPGFGTEHRRRSPASIARITDDIRRRMAGVRGPDRWSVMGISLGGMVALDWCSRFPADFESCVTVNTSANPSPREDRFRARGPRTLATLLFGRPLARERAVLRLTSNAASDNHEALAMNYAQWFADAPPSLSNIARQLLAASTFEIPQRVATPLLVLSSTADGLVSYRCSEAVATALHAPIRLHDSAGHDLTLDVPEWTQEQVAHWLDARAAFAATNADTGAHVRDRREAGAVT